MNCIKCKYSQELANHPLRTNQERIVCIRYPEHRTFNLPHRCGEYAPKPRVKKK